MHQLIWGRQEVDILLAVNYSINQETAQKLYRTVGTEYYQNIVYPRLLEGTKAIFAEYTAEQLISNREILSEQIANIVVPSVSQYGIVVSSIMVQNIDFTDAFTNAVEAKQVAQQNKLTAQTQQDQLTMEAEQEANKEQEQIINKEKGFCVMLPSHDTVIGDKKFPYSTYANLTLNSKFDPVKKDGNYIYKNAINKSIADFIEEAKADNHFIVTKYTSQYKERKQKGEVVDSWWKLSITKQFTDEKEPEFQTEIQYNNSLESAF